jgi:chromosome segregation ATPase
MDLPGISQLTDSTKGPSQTLDHDLHSLEKNLIQMKNAHAAEKEQLQNELNETRTQLQDLQQAMSKLQHRYESRTKDLHKTRQASESLTEGKTSLEQRVETLRENLSKIKDERIKLKQELEEARQELKTGGGTLAELESAREEIRRLTKEGASLERKAEYSQNQAEYVREQYQTASNVAAQAGNEARQLREENEALKKKVEGNMVQLREINKKNDEARHIVRIEELEMILTARDEVLRKKEEELRDIRKNRPSTRSTSTQPRSPKWAGSRPTSPGVNHNGNGNGLAGRGSALRFSSEMPF